MSIQKAIDIIDSMTYSEFEKFNEEYERLKYLKQRRNLGEKLILALSKYSKSINVDVHHYSCEHAPGDYRAYIKFSLSIENNPKIEMEVECGHDGECTTKAMLSCNPGFRIELSGRNPFQSFVEIFCESKKLQKCFPEGWSLSMRIDFFRSVFDRALDDDLEIGYLLSGDTDEAIRRMRIKQIQLSSNKDKSTQTGTSPIHEICIAEE